MHHFLFLALAWTSAWRCAYKILVQGRSSASEIVNEKSLVFSCRSVNYVLRNSTCTLNDKSATVVELTDSSDSIYLDNLCVAVTEKGTAGLFLANFARK